MLGPKPPAATEYPLTNVKVSEYVVCLLTNHEKTTERIWLKFDIHTGQILHDVWANFQVGRVDSASFVPERSLHGRSRGRKLVSYKLPDKPTGDSCPYAMLGMLTFMQVNDEMNKTSV